MPLAPIIQQDLSKGSNLVANPYVTGRQQSLLLTNLVLDEHGSVRTRDGTIIVTTAPRTEPVVCLFDFIRVDGTIIKLAIQQAPGGGANQLFRRDTTPWTLLGALGTNYQIPAILTFTNLALIINGDTTPYQYDGTTLAVVSASGGGTLPNGARHHTLHQGYYWIWGTDDVTGALDGPSSLRSTDLNDVTDWPNANQIFVDRDSGESAMGMGQFTIAESGISPSTTQILFKQFSAYQMTGVFGSTNPVFAIQRIKSDMGCVAPRTIRFAPGFGLIRLTHRGIALYDGVNDLLISEEIRPLLFGNETYTGIDWTNALGAYGVVVPNPPMYLLFAPTNAGAALTTCFAYDLVRRAWTVLAYPNTVACAETIQAPNTTPVTLLGDYSQGRVRSIFNPAASDATTDDGTAINWAALLRPGTGGSPQQRAYFRRVIVKAFNATLNQTIAYAALFGPVVTASPLTKYGTLVIPAAVPPTQPAGGGYGVSPYGLLPWGDVMAGSEVDLTIDLGVIATNCRLLLSGQGAITLRGLEWHVGRKPLARPSAYTALASS